MLPPFLSGGTLDDDAVMTACPARPITPQNSPRLPKTMQSIAKTVKPAGLGRVMGIPGKDTKGADWLLTLTGAAAPATGPAAGRPAALPARAAAWHILRRSSHPLACRPPNPGRPPARCRPL